MAILPFRTTPRNNLVSFLTERGKMRSHRKEIKMTEKEKQPADNNSTIRLLLGLLAVPAFMMGKEIYKKYKTKKESEDTNGKNK